MSYRIDKGIPLIEKGPDKYPLLEMEVGDSFLMPDARSQDAGRVVQYGRRVRPTATFVSRKVEGGIRIWRVS